MPKALPPTPDDSDAILPVSEYTASNAAAIPAF
jgi:hypothetical protein